MDKQARIISLIWAYENGDICSETAIRDIEAVTGKELTAYTLDNYWKSGDVEELAAVLVGNEITDWEKMDDTRALALIQEILDDVTHEPTLMRNAEALEKRYQKSRGTVMDYIFQDDITDAIEILRLLAEVSTIQL